MKAEPENTNFSGQRCGIPFGKYEFGSDDIFPCNESMVGREGARAKLIDFLTNGGTRKAILITGRRGMGKTSFVNYCIKEYEQKRVERYWSSDFSRSLGSYFWHLLTVTLIVTSFVIISQLLSIFLYNVDMQPYLWMPILLLIVMLCLPLWFAVEIFKSLLRTIPNVPNFFAYFIALFISVLCYFFNHTSPLFFLSELALLTSTAYFIGEIIRPSKTLKKKIFGLYWGSIFIFFSHTFLLF